MADPPPDNPPNIAGRVPASDPPSLAATLQLDDTVFVMSRDRVRELDRRAVADFGVPSIVLMENAAVHLAQHAVALLDEAADTRVAICCGPGNNGGDGLAVARHVANAGIAPTVLLLAPPDAYAGDAGANLAIDRAMGLDIRAFSEHALDPADPPGLIVDAIFGTGLTRPPAGVFARAIERINACGSGRSLVLAVDIPSGLDADSGRPLGMSVEADLTVTLAAVKPGFLALEAQGWLGELVVADIGAPRSLVEALGEPLEDRPGPDRADDQAHPKPPPETDGPAGRDLGAGPGGRSRD